MNLGDRSTPEDVLNEDEDIENIQVLEELADPSDTRSRQEDEIIALASECRVLDTDLRLSIEIIEETIAEGKTPRQVEITDIDAICSQYLKAYIRLIFLCETLELDTKDHEERRKRFMYSAKKTKNQIIELNLPSTTSNFENERNSDCTSRLKLRKIEIPIFSGKSAAWPRWKTVFETFVSNSNHWNFMEKHQILLSKVEGEPYNLIEEIPTPAYKDDADAFNIAWKALLDQYDDPLESVSRYLKALEDTPPKSSLKTLVTHYRANVIPLRMVFEKDKSIDVMSQFVIHSFLKQADKGSNIEWQRELQRKQVMPTIDDFLKFMTGRYNSYERATNSSNNPGKGSTSSGRTLAATSSVQKKSFRCVFCKSSSQHYLSQCTDFLKLSTDDRFAFVRKKQMCRKCLRTTCDRSCNFSCSVCKKAHHSTIHIDFSKKLSSTPAPSKETGKSNLPVSNTVLLKETMTKFTLMCAGWVGSLVTDDLYSLLATAVVEVSSSNSPTSSTRAVVDGGSQYNFITNKLARQLHASLKNASYEIRGIGNMLSTADKCTTVTIKSRYSSFNCTINCLVVDEILDFIPSQKFSIKQWNFPTHLSLADPQFNVPQSADMLLGLGVFWKILKPTFRDLGYGSPRLIATHLGWLVSGEMKLSSLNDRSLSNYNFLISEPDVLAQTIQKLWLIEETKYDSFSSEEIECENHFLANTIRNKEGRFVVKLPFKIPIDHLGNSKQQALKRFLNLERRLTRDAELRDAYTSCLNGYLQLGHMKEVKENDNFPHFYLPHHNVTKMTSTSTTHRVVFDASMSTSSGLSLNQCLMVGPVVQSDLFSIMIRSRVHKYVISADISQMYRQVLVNKNDTRFQRIFWRNSPDEPLKVYELQTVTFGVATAPFLATRCLQKLAEDAGDLFPNAKTALSKDFYVDDVFTGTNTVDSCIRLRNELDQLLLSAGFRLSKWSSNNQSILVGIPEEKLEKKFPLYFGNELVIKTLGILWTPPTDEFHIWVHVKEILHPSKRQALSIISSIFDPLGFLGPVTVLAKIFMQQLWSHSTTDDKSLKWDDPLPEHLLPQWQELNSQLPYLEKLSLPRYIFGRTEPKSIELHGFCDASEKAYGAVIYIRSINQEGITVKLLCSRNKVAPLKRNIKIGKTTEVPTKSRSIAELELCGALLLSELINKVESALNNTIKIDLVRLWCDSKTTLCWLNSHPSRWTVFVANRVQKIQSYTQRHIWDYIPSQSNPADTISRGSTPTSLLNHKTWWSGGPWLQNKTFTKEVSFIVSRNYVDSETRSTRKVICSAVFQSTYFDRFSNYSRLIRTTAWVLRFIWNCCPVGREEGHILQLYEIEQATMVLVKLVQRQYFSTELKDLRQGKNVALNSPLSALSPFLDGQEIIRVGGRLQESKLSFAQRFPILLPSKHMFTKLLITHEHKIHFHAGPQALRSVLRRRWWILSLTHSVQQCIYKCHDCVRIKADTRTQMMANLPKARVVPNRPFLITGADYTGPFLVREKGRGRQRVLRQSYIALFVCFSTKALHLEIVSDLTTESFLAAFTRFISRRGLPHEVQSDNGGNFTGAAKQIKTQIAEFISEKGSEIIDFASSKGIDWHFNPPTGPHFGGLWEAGVKSVKVHLKTTLKGQIFTYEQMETYLTQIEAILNSRPLTVESSDPNEPTALTPGHFLIGGPITALPNIDLTSINANQLKYWERVKQQVQFFWQRWHREYLHTLQLRSKWRQAKNNVHVGDVVLILEENVAPTHWPLAVICAVHPNKDGLIRKVTVRMRVGSRETVLNTPIKTPLRTAEFVRPITKLIYLPAAE